MVYVTSMELQEDQHVKAADHSTRVLQTLHNVIQGESTSEMRQSENRYNKR